MGHLHYPTISWYATQNKPLRLLLLLLLPTLVF
jgi:hypothetical protein